MVQGRDTDAVGDDEEGRVLDAATVDEDCLSRANNGRIRSTVCATPLAPNVPLRGQRIDNKP